MDGLKSTSLPDLKENNRISDYFTVNDLKTRYNSGENNSDNEDKKNGNNNESKTS